MCEEDSFMKWVGRIAAILGLAAIVGLCFPLVIWLWGRVF